MTWDDLIIILQQDKPSEIIKLNEDELFKLIPELVKCKNFEQNSVWHIYDVYEHILHVIDNVHNNLVLRLAALFHDIGKPLVYIKDESGRGHFYGHWHRSKEIFDKYAEKYNLDNSLKSKVSNLILYHDLNIDKITEEEIERIINKFDKDGISMLFQLKEADLLAQNSEFHYLLDDYKKQKQKILNMIKI